MAIAAMNSLTPNQVRDMFLYVGQKVVENKPFLTKIDSAIGDGDHGIGMSVGFTIEEGLTDFNVYEVELKRKMVEKSNKIVALLDNTKNWYKFNCILCND